MLHKVSAACDVARCGLVALLPTYAHCKLWRLEKTLGIGTRSNSGCLVPRVNSEVSCSALSVGGQSSVCERLGEEATGFGVSG